MILCMGKHGASPRMASPHYVGTVPGWKGDCCHGSDEARVYRRLCEIVDEWIKVYQEEKRPLPTPTNRRYSGKFVLRTGREMHRALAARALNKGESLNTYVVKTLKKAALV
jgi:predicted HicB family RNase H-like nuclease